MAGPILLVCGPVGVGKTTVSRLVAGACDPAFHLPIDTFARFRVGGDPWHPDHHDAVGAAAIAAAWQFALGGSTVVVDGHLLPDAVDQVTRAGASQGITVRAAFLRADLATCLARVEQRDPAHLAHREGMAALHARYADLGPHEANVVDASRSPAEVAVALLALLD